MSAVAAPATRVATAERITSGVSAALALALGLAITFVADHSAHLGLLAFGLYATASAVPLGVLAALRRRAGRPALLVALRALVGLAAGVVALVVVGSAAVALLVALVSGWALVTGAIGIVEGLLERRRDRAVARDAMLLGGLTVLLAVVLLVIPPDFLEPWRVVSGGTVQAEGAVTTSVMAVGLLGGWAIIAGVLQAIAAIGPAPRAGDAS
ncbi:MAG: hypothetical protein J0G30_03210 [Actinomycetales bacterium]|nr:hypothetical protein [Actinomycetales bacterium]